ncbi:MAG TPA: DNA polymerase III subunit beta [Gammaproteobacteria bacterium]|nr:DNA polymerase III subunit beta [Gammaproteobacteria bacterium]
MKFQIQREALLKPLQQIVGVVERRQTLPVLSNVLVNASGEGITLTATDLEVELMASTVQTVAEPGETTLPARKILDICRTLPEQATLEVTVDQERAMVRSGRSRFTLATLPAAEFPVVEDVKAGQSFEVPQKDLRELIERTHFSMAQQDVRYYLNGLMLEMGEHRLRAVATDGHRLALCDMGASIEGGSGEQVIVPRKGVMELLRLLEDSDAPVQVQVGSNHIRVSVPEIRFTSKLIDGRFPDYDRVVPTGGDKRMEADRELLRQALARTSILSNEKYRGIRLNLEPGALRIQAHNPEQEEAEEEIEVAYDGEPLEIGFNVTYLMEALGAIPGERVTVTLRDSNSSSLIEEVGGQMPCKYVVMPMRL